MSAPVYDSGLSHVVKRKFHTPYGADGFHTEAKPKNMCEYYAMMAPPRPFC